MVRDFLNAVLSAFGYHVAGLNDVRYFLGQVSFLVSNMYCVHFVLQMYAILSLKVCRCCACLIYVD